MAFPQGADMASPCHTKAVMYADRSVIKGHDSALDLLIVRTWNHYVNAENLKINTASTYAC